MCRALEFLGNVFVQTGHYLQALPRLEEALALVRGVGDEEIELECLSNLSFALTNVDRPQEALPYQLRALELVRRQGDREAEVHELGKLGITYAHMDQMTESLACHEEEWLIKTGARPRSSGWRPCGTGRSQQCGVTPPLLSNGSGKSNPGKASGMKATPFVRRQCAYSRFSGEQKLGMDRYRQWSRS